MGRLSAVVREAEKGEGWEKWMMLIWHILMFGVRKSVSDPWSRLLNCVLLRKPERSCSSLSLFGLWLMMIAD